MRRFPSYEPPHRPSIGSVCRLLFAISSTRIELAEIEITLYFRCTISPSEARNTSSPCSRNASRLPSAPVTVPKNFRSMGGGGGGPGGGGGGGGGPGLGRTDTIGFGISTGIDVAEKIFRPLPEYSSDSVTSIACMRSVGSNCADVVPRFFAAGPADLPGGTATAAPVFVAGAAAFTGALTVAGATGRGGLSSWKS